MNRLRALGLTAAIALFALFALFALPAPAADSWSLFHVKEFEAMMPVSLSGTDDDIKTPAGNYRQQTFIAEEAGGRVFAVIIDDYAKGSFPAKVSDDKLRFLIEAYGMPSGSKVQSVAPVTVKGRRWMEGELRAEDDDRMTVRITAIGDRVAMAVYAHHGKDTDVSEGRRFLDSVKLFEPTAPSR